MADIVIVRKNQRAIISPDSEKGKKWIEDNIILTHGTTLIIQSDLVEDFIKDIEIDDLSYEER